MRGADVEVVVVDIAVQSDRSTRRAEDGRGRRLYGGFVSIVHAPMAPSQHAYIPTRQTRIPHARMRSSLQSVKTEQDGGRSDVPGVARSVVFFFCVFFVPLLAVGLLAGGRGRGFGMVRRIADG